MKRNKITYAATALLLCMTAACGPTKTATNANGSTDTHGTLRVALPFQLGDWDTFDKPNTTYTLPVYEQLVTLGTDGFTLEPKLATAWTITPTAITFTLRPGVFFQDGTAFDAQAVIANLNHVRNSPDEFVADLSPVSQMVATDPLHLTLKLSRPAPTLVAQLARRGGFMISPKAIADGSYKTAPDGTGPYTYDAAASVPGSTVEYRFNPKYWDAKDVGPHTLVLRYIADEDATVSALTTGQVDVAEIAATDISRVDAAGMQSVSYAGIRYHFLFFDRTKTFANVDVRKAVCSALDPQAMITAQFNGVGTTSDQRFNPGEAGYDSSITGYPYDIAAAKQYMAEAGNPKISFTFPVFPGTELIGQLVASELGQIGINVDVQQLDTSQYFSTALSGKYVAAYNGGDEEDSGPYDFYTYDFAPGGNGTFNVYNDDVPALDQLANKGLNDADPTAQAADWQSMTQYINDQALACGYFDRPITFAWNVATVANVQTTAFQPSAFDYAAARTLS